MLKGLGFRELEVHGFRCRELGAQGLRVHGVGGSGSEILAEFRGCLEGFKVWG